MPEAGEPPSVPVAVTGKTRVLSRCGSGLIVLVGGVVSMSHWVESELLPALAILVLDVGRIDGQRIFARCAVVRPDRPLIW